MLSQCLILLPNSGSAAHNSEANTQETTVDWKWKLALFKRPATEEKADSCPKTNSKDSVWSQKFLKGESFQEEDRIYYLSLWADFLQIHWWWGNTVMFQESCAQSKVNILPLVGGLSSYRRTQRYCYICSLRKNQDPVPCCTMVSWLLSLTSLISNCFNLPFGTQGRPRRLNEACLLQNVKGLYSEGPTGPYLVSVLLSLITVLLSAYWYLL